MAVTIQMIRDRLNNIGIEQIPDDTISEGIKSAAAYVQRKADSNAPIDLLEACIKDWATLEAYTSYITMVERDQGTYPENAVTHIAILRDKAERTLESISKSRWKGTPAAASPVSKLKDWSG